MNHNRVPGERIHCVSQFPDHCEHRLGSISASLFAAKKTPVVPINHKLDSLLPIVRKTRSPELLRLRPCLKLFQLRRCLVEKKHFFYMWPKGSLAPILLRSSKHKERKDGDH